ncbi:FadR/GntR family transcriptional regulator [uncultured Bartonella sp.]|uniref:FadR/GntR family transcriptional regulator n=1 Tax=uncultured Bartonella sp. TaxID=104108 RepID=UPI00260878D9|nr:FadR/GntR family transcriptional regulator [uncultured Bartonella sp.]
MENKKIEPVSAARLANNAIEFPPVKRRATLADQIVEVLHARITSGDLSAGDQLPTEQQLSDGFQVSRAVVREAIARLKQTGMIRTQQGRGAFVVEADNDMMLKLSLRSHDVQPIHVMELRRIIEVAAAQFAAQRRSDKDIEALNREISILENCGDDLMKRAQADMCFHQAIAVASANPLFVTVLEKLHQTIIDFLKLAHGNTSKVKGAFHAAENEHRQIVEAIINGNEEDAGKAMLQHLERSSVRLSIYK